MPKELGSCPECHMTAIWDTWLVLEQSDGKLLSHSAADAADSRYRAGSTQPHSTVGW